MKELTINELIAVEGGGLTLTDILGLIGGLALAGPAWPATVITFVLFEYEDYKNGK